MVWDNKQGKLLWSALMEGFIESFELVTVETEMQPILQHPRSQRSQKPVSPMPRPNMHHIVSSEASSIIEYLDEKELVLIVK